MKKVCLSLILAFSMLLTTACLDKEPEIPSNQVVKNGISNLSSIDSLSFLISADGELNSEQAVDGVKDLFFDATINGKALQTDSENQKYEMKVEGKGGSSKDSMSELGFELKVAQKTAYFNISKVPNVSEAAQFLTLFADKWWKTEIPEEGLTGMSLPSGASDNMTPEEKKIKEIFNNSDFFTNFDFEGIEDVGGVKAYHYKGNLDKNNLKKFLMDSAVIKGTPLSAADESNLDEYLKDLKFDPDLWITVEGSYLTKLSGNLFFESKEGSGIDANIEIVFSDFNKQFEMELPTDATDIKDFLSDTQGLLAPEEGDTPAN